MSDRFQIWVNPETSTWAVVDTATARTGHSARVIGFGMSRGSALRLKQWLDKNADSDDIAVALGKATQEERRPSDIKEHYGAVSFSDSLLDTSTWRPVNDN